MTWVENAAVEVSFHCLGPMLLVSGLKKITQALFLYPVPFGVQKEHLGTGVPACEFYFSTSEEHLHPWVKLQTGSTM